MSSIIKIVIFIAVGLTVNEIVNLIFRAISRKKRAAHIRFLNRVVNVIIFVVMIYALAQQFELTKEFSTTLLQSGSLIIAIATFAAQQTLSNVISGFSLSFSNPYEVNDKVKVVQGGNIIAEGVVIDITLRHTIIRQFNGECCIVPNSVMDTSVITNTNFTGNIGNFMEIEIGYDADVQKAMAIMKRLCAENERTLNTLENKVFIKGYTQNGMVLKTTVWTENLDDSFQACSEIRGSLVEEFRREGIRIPYQTVTVNSEQKPQSPADGAKPGRNARKP